MNDIDKRKSKRYSTFIQLTLSNCDPLGKVTGWIKDVSQKGIALETCISSADELLFLKQLVSKKDQVNAAILLSGGLSLNVKSKVVWGRFSENETFCSIGLQILTVDPLLKHKWNSFVKKFS